MALPSQQARHADCACRPLRLQESAVPACWYHTWLPTLPKARCFCISEQSQVHQHLTAWELQLCPQAPILASDLAQTSSIIQSSAARRQHGTQKARPCARRARSCVQNHVVDMKSMFDCLCVYAMYMVHSAPMPWVSERADRR